MQIREFLSPDDVLIDIPPADKPRLLQDLAARAASVLGLDPSLVALAVLRREALGSTGTGGGVAIPHARIADLRAPFGTLARLARKIDFDSIDGEPVDIVFLLLLPQSGPTALDALASVARELRTPDSLSRLRSAADERELYYAIEWGADEDAAVRG